MQKAIASDAIEAARADRQDRAARQAHHCICFAIVTPEPLAAELIDKAVELRRIGAAAPCVQA